MTTKSSQYALKAVIYLSYRQGKAEMIGMPPIAQAIKAPKHLRQKVMQILTGENIVSSVWGVHGGFNLEATSKDNHNDFDTNGCISSKIPRNSGILGTVRFFPSYKTDASINTLIYR